MPPPLPERGHFWQSMAHHTHLGPPKRINYWRGAPITGVRDSAHDVYICTICNTHWFITGKNNRTRRIKKISYFFIRFFLIGKFKRISILNANTLPNLFTITKRSYITFLVLVVYPSLLIMPWKYIFHNYNNPYTYLLHGIPEAHYILC